MAISIKIEKIPTSRINQCDFKNVEFGKAFSDHMFMADYENGDWQNPRIIPFGNIQMSPSISSLHYGQSIFEGMKAYKNRNNEAFLFRPLENWKRFNISAKRMGMPTIPSELFMGGVEELVRLDQDWIPNSIGDSLYIRPVMFATDEYVGLRPSTKYSFIIFTCPATAYYTKPINVKVEKKYVRSCTGSAGFAKAAGNYGITMLPSLEAREQGYEQIIWTDGESHQYVEESGATNLFFVINNKVLTPELDGNILPGITRMSCTTLLKDCGYEIEERKITVQEIYEAAKSNKLMDAFGTGTAAAIVKIARIGFDSELIELPDPCSREVSSLLYKKLQEIHYGISKDIYDWMHKI